MTRDDVIHRAAAESKDHRGHVLIWVSFAVLLIGALSLATVVFIGRAQNTSLADQVAVLTQRADDNARAAGQLADQVRGLGAIPVTVPGATGASGPAGPQGPKGDKGDPGMSPPCLAEPDRCRGPVGEQGPAGETGATGEQGEAGPQGPAGPAGEPGPQGAQGAPGPACPDGYELRDAVITAPDGTGTVSEHERINFDTVGAADWFGWRYCLLTW